MYLSLDVGVYFQLDAVELVIDDETATHYLYTERQVNALKRGGVQRLYMGNVNQGAHQLTAFLSVLDLKIDRTSEQSLWHLKR